MKFTTKILTFIFFLIALVITKLIVFDYPVSTGKRVGNLTKLSLKGKVFKTWEGTIDEGSGDKLTTYFSVRDSRLAQELYEFEGRQVVLYYEEYYLGWPRDTKYNITAWKPQDNSGSPKSTGESIKALDDQLISRVGKTLFCSFLGTLINDQALYDKVKAHIEKNNLYLFKQYDSCNK